MLRSFCYSKSDDIERESQSLTMGHETSREECVMTPKKLTTKMFEEG